MSGSWTPEHHAAYRATIEARRAAVARGERAPFKRNAPLTDAERQGVADAMDRALAGVGARIVVDAPPKPAGGSQPKDKRCLCTHTHYRGQPDPKNGNRRPDLGCTEKGCPCPGWSRRGMAGATDATAAAPALHQTPVAVTAVTPKARKVRRAPQIRPVRDASPQAAHPEPERIQGQSPAEYVKSELALLGREAGEMLRALEAAAGNDAKVLDRIESVRQMVLRLSDRIALQPLRPSPSTALVPLSADALWRSQVQKALVRILTEQRRQAITFDAIRVELARVAARPSVIREFRPVHRRTADGGHPVSRQRRRAGVGRAPRVVEPTARAG